MSSHGKQVVLDNRKPSAREYLVISTRGASGFVAYNWETAGQMLRPLFEPVSHGGVPAPVDQHMERRFGGSRVFREGLTISEESYSDSATTTSRCLRALTPPLRGIPPSNPW